MGDPKQTEEEQTMQAFNRIVSHLEDFDIDTRLRILSAAAILLGVDVQMRRDE